MSVKIRLAKTGKKNAPAYKVVVAQTRSKRNGKFLDLLGHYNPIVGEKPVIDTAKVDAWVKKGATLTNAVKQMLEGTYKYTKYDPKAKIVPSSDAFNNEETKEHSAEIDKESIQ